MALIFDTPPVEVRQTLDAALPRLATRLTAAPATQPLGRASLSDRAPQIARGVTGFLAAGRDQGPVAVPVHVVGLDTLAGDAGAAGGAVRATRARLWTSLLTDEGGRTAALADVEPASRTLAALTEGPTITAMGARLESLAAEEHDGPDRSVAMLRVPALHLTALWLKGAAGAEDVVIPNPGPIAPLEAGRRYSMTEFLDIVRPMAADRIRQTQATSGG